MSNIHMKFALSTRAYCQTARAESTAATGLRIVEAFLTRLGKQWYDEITLDQVAGDAGVTVQTVVRRFGGKAGLLEEAIREMMHLAGKRRATPPGDLERLVRNLVDDYERTGDTIIRLLALEGRHVVLHENLSHGRDRHRDWVGKAFAGDVELLEAKSRQAVIDALVIATDVYTWKLLRRDMGRSVAATRIAIIGMIRTTLTAAMSCT